MICSECNGEGGIQEQDDYGMHTVECAYCKGSGLADWDVIQEQDEPYEQDDCLADAEVLANIGWGTTEDYVCDEVY